ncbi:5-formyltetrahydrofolate cyclo-ligase [Phycisphaerales bacterium AB-hyl4]|uniref:5-formyltetrahydrofolate cyclo-ligase n=1 Tax=Natronomicrosphaera hydrolytica TaxID=3242702 RepID=A0ABV4U0C0_9BACT
MTADATTQAKAVLRRTMLAKRAVLSADDVATWSQAITARALDLPELEEARSAFVYVSIEREVDTRPLLAALLERDITVAVPFIAGPGRLEAHHITSLDHLTPGRYGIPAPAHPSPFTDTPDVCLTPAVALTEHGERMGMGGGYYDRYLAQHHTGVIIALAFEMQIVPHIPTEPTDRRVNTIVTDRRVIRCSPPPSAPS